MIFLKRKLIKILFQLKKDKYPSTNLDSLLKRRMQIPYYRSATTTAILVFRGLYMYNRVYFIKIADKFPVWRFSNRESKLLSLTKVVLIYARIYVRI